MTHTLCPRCRLRFTSVAVADDQACPTCGEPTEAATAIDAMGYRLFDVVDLVEALPAALAAALSPPPSHRRP